MRTPLRPTLARQKGQALLLTTFSLTALFGMMGLAIDVGYGHYNQRVAQSAADSAALASASAALDSIGQVGTPGCGGNVQCGEATACPAGGNFAVACKYASNNGIAQGGRQAMRMAGGVNSTAPGVPDVGNVLYWTQAVATQNSTQLFSFAGGKNMNVAARSTAAVYDTKITPSLYLLNRSSDCFASALSTLGVVCGENFLSALGATVNARGGIYMSSTNGTGTSLLSLGSSGIGVNVAAGTVVGSATVNSPFTYLMGNGGISALGISNWSSAPQNGFPDGDDFRDPMRGKGQPPAPSGLNDHPVPAGLIVGSLLSGIPTVLPPGNYYASNPLTGRPLGTPITITGNVVFSDGSSNPCNGFCNYVFYGGLVTGALATTTFSPGRYVFAGAQPVAGLPGVGLMVGLNSIVRDQTPLVAGKITQNTDAGEIFIFTDSNYPGLHLPDAIENSGISFPQVQAGVQGGLGYQATLHGLNASSPHLPADLKPFAPVLIWQDQANTTLKFTGSGTLDVSCGAPCSNVLSVPGSQELILQASQVGGRPGVNLYGTIYTPRASWITVLGLLPGDTIAGPVQIITGALQMAVSTTLDVDPVTTPLTRRTVSLIQ